MSKVIARVFGGLGNQLFIYATARALSLRFNSNLHLEVRSGFIRDNYNRKFKLDQFNITNSKCSFLKSLYFIIKKRYPLFKFLYRNNYHLKELNPRSFQDEILKIIPEKEIIYFEGYWQSPNYFIQFEDEIRNDLKIIKKISTENKSIALNIKLNESVSIHVRRVDYNNTINIDYYFKAIQVMQKNLLNPCFYIFSDDMFWCKENFKHISNKYFVDNNKDDEVSDLYLMSQCKHFIIANSSFSWWGAWLSEYQNKIVIAPSYPGIGCENFYLENWIKL